MCGALVWGHTCGMKHDADDMPPVVFARSNPPEVSSRTGFSARCPPTGGHPTQPGGSTHLAGRQRLPAPPPASARLACRSAARWLPGRPGRAAAPPWGLCLQEGEGAVGGKVGSAHYAAEDREGGAAGRPHLHCWALPARAPVFLGSRSTHWRRTWPAATGWGYFAGGIARRRQSGVRLGAANVARRKGLVPWRRSSTEEGFRPGKVPFRQPQIHRRGEQAWLWAQKCMLGPFPGLSIMSQISDPSLDCELLRHIMNGRSSKMERFAWSPQY